MHQKIPPFLTLRRVNNVLTIAVIALAMYIALMPFLPSMSWWAKYEAPVISKNPATSMTVPQTTPIDNTVIIPSIGIKETIYDGPTAATLRQGIWHRPKSSAPSQSSNTVLAGHRFTYSGKAVFYNLDKVKVRDPIVLYWDGKRYDYIVSNILVVPPTQVSVEAATPEPLLTIYTCTPLWSAKDRLVIQAKLVETS